MKKIDITGKQKENDMKKEDKDLQLRDLCARLPYGVKVKTPNDDEVYTLLSLNPNKGIAVIGMPFDDVFATSKVKVEDIKPYLRPMSSMTEKEEEEYEEVVRGSFEKQLEFYQRKHLDFRGLIPKGLAIEATEDMYSE